MGDFPPEMIENVYAKRVYSLYGDLPPEMIENVYAQRVCPALVSGWA